MSEAALRGVARSAVRFRFQVSEDAFVALLLERAAVRAAGRPPAEYAATLCLDDLYLAVACVEGDDRAWQECRDRFFDYIRQFAQRFADDLSARDVADQIIADLWQRQRFTLYDGRSTLRTWLGTVAANAAINAAKRSRRRHALDVDAFDRRRSRPAATADEDAETRRAFAVIVQRAVTALEPAARLLLLLYYEQGLTLEQMSVVLSASKATLSRRLDRVRQALRGEIDRLARDELKLSADAVRKGIDLRRLDINLSEALADIAMQQRRREGV